MLKLYLIRHGETKWNCESKTQGCKNIELTQLGLSQSKMIAKKLKALNDRYVKIYTSDLDRSYLTGKEISDELNIEIEVNKDLREMSFGDWEGLTLKEIQKSYSKEYLEWRNEPYKASIPSGEKLTEVQKRCLNVINQIINKYDDGSIIVVSHGVAIKVMIMGLLGFDLKHFYSISLNNASINKVEFRDYGPVLVSLNDICHLKTRK